jgi:hypothetical protein
MNPEDYKMWCYFAGMAMQAMAPEGGTGNEKLLATRAFKVADAMMKERDRKNPPSKESK